MMTFVRVALRARGLRLDYQKKSSLSGDRSPNSFFLIHYLYLVLLYFYPFIFFLNGSCDTESIHM